MTPRELAEKISKIIEDDINEKLAEESAYVNPAMIESLLTEAMAEAGKEAVQGVLDRRYGSYQDGKAAAYEECARLAENLDIEDVKVVADKIRQLKDGLK